MKKLIIFYLAVILCAGAALAEITAEKEPAAVYLVAGQSNTDGRVSNDLLPDYIKNDGYQHCKWSYGSGTLSGQGCFTSYFPRVAKKDNVDRWGYDAVVYYLIEKVCGRDFYVIKESLGGTSIDPMCASTDDMHWSAAPSYLDSVAAADKGGKSLLKAFTDNIGACIDGELSALPDGYEIKASLWHQGESDKCNPADYYDNLKAVVEYVRTYVAEKTGNPVYKNLDFICGTFSILSRDRRDEVEAALRRLDDEDAAFHVIDMSDGTLLADRLHFDAEGAELFGKRVFQKLDSLGLVPHVSPKVSE